MKEPNSKSGSPGQAALGYLSALYSYAMTLTHDGAMAEDLVRETYLRAVSSFDRLTPSSNLKGWLFAIMRTVWSTTTSQSRSGAGSGGSEGSELSPSDPGEAGGNNPHVIFMRKITRDEVRAAIDSLPVHYREVVMLRDLEDFSYQEIAAVLGCPVGTVMSRLARAREKLRLLLDQWQGVRTKAKA